MNIKLLVAYEGTHYLGWQKTKMGKSIEEMLEGAIQKVLQQPVQLQAASRTDRGVHAAGQLVNFCIEQEEINLAALHRGINACLRK